MEAAVAVRQLDALISEHGARRAQSQHDDLSDLPKDELEALAVRLDAAVRRLAMRGSTYVQQADHARNYEAFARIPRLLGAVKALRDDYQQGFMESVIELVHAETFSDFLDMASELLDKGYKDAAAVVTGSVLEAHLRELASKHGVAVTTSKGDPAKASTINDNLKKANVYNLNTQKQITADLGTRNSAAHGKYDDYTADTVRLMISAVRLFIASNAA